MCSLHLKKPVQPQTPIQVRSGGPRFHMVSPHVCQVTGLRTQRWTQESSSYVTRATQQVMTLGGGAGAALNPGCLHSRAASIACEANSFAEIDTAQPSIMYLKKLRGPRIFPLR